MEIRGVVPGPKTRSKFARAKRTSLMRVRDTYRSWRHLTKESKLYLAVMFVLCEGKCPKCGVGMILSFTKEDECPRSATLDHINNLSYTEKHEKLGLTILCKACNSRKHKPEGGE